MIDFDKGIEKLSKYGGSERKGAVEYNGELYMIKFPDRTREASNSLSYINNQYSEYIGCHIFQLCGFEAQETKLGVFTDYKGERKMVVGCKDFTQDGSTLYEFNITSCYKIDEKKIVYHEIFKTTSSDLEKAIKRIVPKIDINKITEFVDSVETMSEIRKEYLKHSLVLRYKKILLPSLSKIIVKPQKL